MYRFVAALLAAVMFTALPAAAKQFIQDQAGMLSPATVSTLESHLANFNGQTGKEIVVETVPSVPGGDVRTAALNAYSQQQINGFLIFVDQGDRKDFIIADNAAVNAGWWSAQSSNDVRTAMEAQFRAGDFDGGITTAVNTILDMYRSHLSSLPGNQQPTYGRGANYGYAPQGAGGSSGGIGSIWWIIMAIVAFMVFRSLTRAAAMQRYYAAAPGTAAPGAAPPGTPAVTGGTAPGAPAAPGAAPAAGAPGYAPGYGGGFGGFGGGGFWSGLLGGLGGAWLGNELFGGWGGGFGGMNQGGGMFGGGPMGGAPMGGGGWQADPGQADLGGSAGGDWGGGGFGGGGFGGGDFGGGFGGGADSGGGW